MYHNTEVAEYGLLIPDKFLYVAPCKTCGSLYLPYPGKDWLYCSKCYFGVSRLEQIDDDWRETLTDQQKAVADQYYAEFVSRTQRARKIWKRLAQGDELEKAFKHGHKLDRYFRLVREQRDLDGILDLAINSKSESLKDVKLPCFALRLDDIPARMTGMVLIPSGENPQVVKFVTGPKIAFLQEVSEPLVAVADPNMVITAQARHVGMTGNLLPLVFSDARETPWWPVLPNGFIYHPYELTADDLHVAAKAGCRMYLTGPNSRALSPINASWFCKTAQDRAPSWDVAAGDFIRRLSVVDAADLITRANLSPRSKEILLSRLPDSFVAQLATCFASRPIMCKLNDKKVIFDNGISWLTPSGSVILSGSFSVTGVTREESKMVYDCQLVTDSGRITFRAGKELERDAFKVMMRECLLQGIPLQFDRSYSKYAIEIATRLRPPAPTRLATNYLK